MEGWPDRANSGHGIGVADQASAAESGCPRNVVVLGGGFVGSHVARAFIQCGAEVTIVNRSPLAPFEANITQGAKVIVGDVVDLEMDELAAVSDHFVYAVGTTVPAESARDPMHEITSTMQPLLKTLEALRITNHASLAFVSSGGTVYGPTDSVPISESCPINPRVGYGVLKVAAENYIQMYAHHQGLRATIARVSNPYGPGQQTGRGQGVVAAFIDAASRGVPARIFGDGGNIRDYVYVDDVAAALLALSRLERLPEVVNVGSGRGHSISEVLKLVEAVSGRDLAPEYVADRGFDVRTNILSIRRLQSLIDYAPIQLFDGLELTWADAVEAGRVQPRNG